MECQHKISQITQALYTMIKILLCSCVYCFFERRQFSAVEHTVCRFISSVVASVTRFGGGCIQCHSICSNGLQTSCCQGCSLEIIHFCQPLQLLDVQLLYCDNFHFSQVLIFVCLSDMLAFRSDCLVVITRLTNRKIMITAQQQRK